MKFLIIDDDFVSRIKLEKILGQFGECTVTEEGETGLAEFEQAWRQDTPFDVVCLDVSMPGKDGTEVLVELREMEKKMGVATEKPARVLMITSHRDKDTVVTSIQAGCDGYLVKPFDRHRVINKFKQLGFKM